MLRPKPISPASAPRKRAARSRAMVDERGRALAGPERAVDVGAVVAQVRRDRIDHRGTNIYYSLARTFAERFAAVGKSLLED
jgi:hypothetical protein